MANTPGYKNFLDYIGDYKCVYQRIPQAARRRGKGSLANNLKRSKTPFLNHMHDTIKMINCGEIPLPPDLRKGLTVDDKFYLKEAARNKKKCLKFLRHSRHGAKTAALVGEVINRALQAQQQQSGQDQNQAPVQGKKKARTSRLPAREHETEAAAPPVPAEYETKLAACQAKEDAIRRQMGAPDKEGTGSM